MLITELKQQAKDKNRISVYVDGKFAFGLTLSQVADFGLKKGLELSEPELDDLKNEGEYGKLRMTVINYCLMRERSTKELRDYLWRRRVQKKLSESLTERAMKEILESGIVDDERFAKLWAESRKLRSGISQKKLANELMQKGIDRRLIEKTLGEVFGSGGERDEREELAKLLAKKASKYAGDEQKLKQYLLRQGFGYDVITEYFSRKD